MRRVVITGIGVVGPTGVGREVFWQSLLQGPSGIRRITRFDPNSYSCQVAGEVNDLRYEGVIEPRKLRTATHATRLALAAAAYAFEDARLGSIASPDMFGIAVGTALGGWRDGEQQYAVLLERGARRVNPFIANGAPNHTPAAEIAATLNAQGPQITFTSGCTSALQAIRHGASMVASGEVDVCLVGGFESPLGHLVFSGMTRTQELCTLNDPPERASRPFDRRHAGMVLSEGSCMLVLETQDGAAQRNATPYAEVLGGSSSCDAQGLYAFDPSGEPGARAIHRLLGCCGVELTALDYVCAHANSSAAFDRKEIRVIKKAFGECAARLPISSIKGVIGHPFGASGAFQAAAAALAIQRQLIPPTQNWEYPDPECDLDCVPNEARPANLGTALVTSYGYGGVNSYLLLARATPPSRPTQ